MLFIWNRVYCTLFGAINFFSCDLSATDDNRAMDASRYASYNNITAHFNNGLSIGT